MPNLGGTLLLPYADNIFGEQLLADFGGTPPPPFLDKIRETVFERLPQANVPVVYILSAVFNCASNFTAQLDLDVCPASRSSTKTKIRH